MIVVNEIRTNNSSWDSIAITEANQTDYDFQVVSLRVNDVIESGFKRNLGALQKKLANAINGNKCFVSSILAANFYLNSTATNGSDLKGSRPFNDLEKNVSIVTSDNVNLILNDCPFLSRRFSEIFLETLSQEKERNNPYMVNFCQNKRGDKSWYPQIYWMSNIFNIFLVEKGAT